MDGVLKVNVVNFITVGLIAVVFMVATKWAFNSFAPTYSKYV